MVVTGLLTRTPVTSARFRHLDYQRRNLLTPNSRAFAFVIPV